ncbi:hypothetical protein ACIBI4_04900 [Streptomyces sp. NPDC050418]|uniref:hypothetical protein n=1 Tax=Streptomyces sp. NPDC050418 TaxID=3365612 RepID=UPI00378C82B2
MAEHPGLGVMVARLLERRGLGAESLAHGAGLEVDEVRAVLAGGGPREEFLRCVGPELGVRAVDLYILAGLEVPDEMAPIDASAAPYVRHTVTDAVRLPEAERAELLGLVRALPQEERRSRFAPKGLAPPTGGPGAQIIRMLQYRNLNWLGIAMTLGLVTPTYLSAATYGLIGSERKELTPRLVTDFAALLGIDVRDLATLTGISLPDTPPPPSPRAEYAAVLLWEIRRLSSAQAQHVSEVAHAMKGNG